MSFLLVLMTFFIASLTKAQTFTATSTPLNNARWLHQTSRLPNGGALVTGGQSGGGLISGPESAEIFNPSLGPNGGFTSSINGLSTPRTNHVAVTLNNGQVLIAGGLDQYSDVVYSVELFDPTTGSFTTLPQGINDSYPTTASLLPNGTVLLAGSGAEIYDPTGGKNFKQLTLPNGFDAIYATTLADSRILLISDLQALIFDPSTLLFTAVGNMTMRRCGAAAALLPNGNVLVTGGISSCSSVSGFPTNTAEVFNPNTNTFTALTSTMQSTRQGHTATALYNGTVLVTGGAEDTHGNVILNSTEVYDPIANTFTLSTSSLTYKAASQTATLLTNGNVLIDGGFDGVNNADVYTYPYTLGSLNPKYMILGVVYSPPGATSSVGYSQSTAVGTTTSLTNSVQNSTQDTTSITATLGGKTNIFGLNGSESQTWTSESDTTSSYSVSSTSATGLTAKGPLSSTIGVDHDFDYVLVWLNPQLNLAQGATDQSVLWAGYTYDTNDPNVDNDMDVIQIYVSCLKNYYSTNTNCTDNNYRINRSWDTSGLGGLTAADYATILTADPFATNTSYDPITDASGRFDQYSSINYTPAPSGNGVSCYTGTFTNTKTSMAGQGTSMTYAVSDTFSATLLPILKANFKSVSTQTLTDKWSTNYNQSVGQTNNYNVCAPLYTDNYTGPTAYTVFRDNIYGTYMFYAPGSAPSSPGTLTLSPANITFPKTLLGNTSTQQMTLTYTTGPNETSNAVGLTLQSPASRLLDGTSANTAYSIQSGNDHCSGQTLAVGQSCTFTLAYSPTSTDESTSGTLVATGVTNGIVSNSQTPLTLAASTGQQLTLQAQMSSTSFSLRSSSVVSGQVYCNEDLNCTQINLIVDGTFAASTSLTDENGTFSINMSAVPSNLLSLGSHTLTVQAPGNQYWSSASVNIPFTVVSGQVPTTITPIQSTLTVDAPAIVTFGGSVSCNSACGSVTLTMNGVNLELLNWIAQAHTA